MKVLGFPHNTLSVKVEDTDPFLLVVRYPTLLTFQLSEYETPSRMYEHQVGEPCVALNGGHPTAIRLDRSGVLDKPAVEMRECNDFLLEMFFKHHDTK